MSNHAKIMSNFIVTKLLISFQIFNNNCLFQVLRAEEAGAVAVVVTDQDSDNDELFISMVDDTTGRNANIPAAFVLGKNG